MMINIKWPNLQYFLLHLQNIVEGFVIKDLMAKLVENFDLFGDFIYNNSISFDDHTVLNVPNMQSVGFLINLLGNLLVKTRSAIRSVVFWYNWAGRRNVLIEQVVIFVGFQRNWLIDLGFKRIWVQVSFQVGFEYPARTACASMAWNRQTFIIFAKHRIHYFLSLTLTAFPCDIGPHFKRHNSLDCSEVINCVHKFELNVSCF